MPPIGKYQVTYFQAKTSPLQAKPRLTSGYLQSFAAHRQCKSFDIELIAKIPPLFNTPPSCPSDILPPEGAGNNCGAMASLAPSGGKRSSREAARD